MKGITPVIAIILLLLITISMVGFAFTWFTGIWQSTSQTTQEMQEAQLERQNQKIDIERPKNGDMIIISIGTKSVNVSTLRLYLDDALVDVRYNDAAGDCEWFTTTGNEMVPTDGVITSDCTCTDGQVIKMIAPGGPDIAACDG